MYADWESHTTGDNLTMIYVYPHKIVGMHVCKFHTIDTQAHDLRPPHGVRRFNCVNYEDPNYNVGMPVFSIHGTRPSTHLRALTCPLRLRMVWFLTSFVHKTATAVRSPVCRGMPTFFLEISLVASCTAGNHDDPIGAENLAALDILATCNLVNYFGKTVKPNTIRCIVNSMS